MGSYVSYQHISPSHQAYIANISTNVEPSTYEEAITDSRWVHAMNQELHVLKDNGTWNLIPLPHSQSVIGCKWVCKIKYKSDGTVERYNARLVAKGYNQTVEIDYQETFSLVVKMVTIRMVIALDVAESWPLFQMNVYNAFLQGDLLEDVFIEIPKGLKVQGETPMRKYALELLVEAGLTRGKVALTPLECNMKLTVAEQVDGKATKLVDLVEDVQQYQRMIGKLLYLTISRTDIAYTVHTLSQFM
ncbi:uncharacterized mitochondrial protein AtMg00820-like [Solanum tuberosum]|uniref:uncharacterized mitochondrial protein AtMg00820-like n=1 Tax=Solanum tuberosum TaxID=4113 RepID=UPI00073A22A6|nr:PREDICTED: uncharacterized mitochondrial protein AtMg00820-like [Solanum tuberosum]